VLQITIEDSVRGAIGKRQDGWRRSRRRILWDRRRAQNKKIRNLPVLQVRIEDRAVRRSPHDRAALHMRRLVEGGIVFFQSRKWRNLFRAHGSGNFDSFPIGELREMLGHASTAFTLDIYAHVLPHMQEQAAAQMEGALFDRQAMFSAGPFTVEPVVNSQNRTEAAVAGRLAERKCNLHLISPDSQQEFLEVGLA